MTRGKPGLWFAPTRVEVEEVRKAHRKECSVCGGIPESRRLKVVRGAGRHATTAVYCLAHGVEWLSEFLSQGQRAIIRLESGTGDIRNGE
jgi:hypothetical protein